VLKLIRKSILVLALAGFVSMATGTTIFLHVISTEHHEHHDFNGCPICQQLLLSSKKTIVISKILIQEIEPFTEYVEFFIQEKLPKNKFQSFFSRAPPDSAIYNF
jgi:hypothetical protein